MTAMPLYLKRAEDDPPPEEKLAFIIGKNGAFRYTRHPVFVATVPAEELPMLAEIKEEAEYQLPPIPSEMVLRAVGFFRQVYEKRKSEAVLVITFDVARGEFGFVAPKQRVSAGHCHYDMPMVPSGGRVIFAGTIHSHGSMDAFHSGTDTHDERFFDGIHITVGHVDEPRVALVSTLAVKGKRFPQEVTRVIAGARKIPGGFVLDPVPEGQLPPKPEEELPPPIFEFKEKPDKKLLSRILNTIGWKTAIFRFPDKGKTRSMRYTPPEMKKPSPRGHYVSEGWVFDLPEGVSLENCAPNSEWETMIEDSPVGADISRYYQGIGGDEGDLRDKHRHYYINGHFHKVRSGGLNDWERRTLPSNMTESSSALVAGSSLPASTTVNELPARTAIPDVVIPSETPKFENTEMIPVIPDAPRAPAIGNGNDQPDDNTFGNAEVWELMEVSEGDKTRGVSAENEGAPAEVTELGVEILGVEYAEKFRHLEIEPLPEQKIIGRGLDDLPISVGDVVNPAWFVLEETRMKDNAALARSFIVLGHTEDADIAVTNLVLWSSTDLGDYWSDGLRQKIEQCLTVQSALPISAARHLTMANVYSCRKVCSERNLVADQI